MKRVSVYVATAVCVLALMIAPAAAQKTRTVTPEYNEPIPCILPTGKCIMQTGAACDKAGGEKVTDCKTCKEWEEKQADKEQ